MSENGVKKPKLIETAEDAVGFLFLILIILCIIVFSVVGYIDERYVSRVVNMDGVAVLESEYIQPYLYSPRYGGRVVEKNDYYANYVFRVDDTEINIPIMMYSLPEGGWPETISIMYNPTNPNEYMFDIGPLYGDENMRWRRSKDLHGYGW